MKKLLITLVAVFCLSFLIMAIDPNRGITEPINRLFTSELNDTLADTLELDVLADMDSLIATYTFLIDTTRDTSAGAGVDTFIVDYYIMGSFGFVDTFSFDLNTGNAFAFADAYDNSGNLMLLNANTQMYLQLTPNDADSMKVSIAMACKRRGPLGIWTSVNLFGDSLFSVDSIYIDTLTTAFRNALNRSDTLRYIITSTDRGSESLTVKTGFIYGE